MREHEGQARCEAPRNPAVRCAGRPTMLVTFEFPTAIRGPIEVRMCQAHHRACRTWHGYQGAVALPQAAPTWQRSRVALAGWVATTGARLARGAGWCWSELTRPRMVGGATTWAWPR